MSNSPEQLRRLYEEQTGLPWSDAEGANWLRINRESLDVHTKVLMLDKTAHLDLSDKANWLSQLTCRICRPGFPIHTVPLRIRPESWQALRSLNKGAFKAAVEHRLTTGPHPFRRLEGRICLSILFVCNPTRRMRDLDNMAKLLIDSLEGLVMANDRDIDHLNLIRMEQPDDEEYMYFHVSSSNLNDHADVVVPVTCHSWAGAPALALEDFMPPERSA